VEEVAADPQALALGIFQTGPHPTIPTLMSVGPPFLLGGDRPPLRRHPPMHGEHTREVLAELGFRHPEVEALLGSAASTGTTRTPAARPVDG
jgi:crotonobetainyl-CoA:carnitine CoA-transferase CaiB-like acyl-CoA transferase